MDWDDPEVPGDDEGQREGDVVVTYGNYIMDTEHSNFFEIHPVRAYYLVARNNRGREPVLLNDNMEQEEYGFENFDQREDHPPARRRDLRNYHAGRGGRTAARHHAHRADGPVLRSDDEIRRRRRERAGDHVTETTCHENFTMKTEGMKRTDRKRFS